ncbi:MAG TPA: hypothetical protein PLJ60_17390 [Chryseolinea sp.]|nr:hypothetical protein [Chryseolinea sp.]HPH46475.1 hypothetical protein [Chryseolinea sp.]HPM32110.1 hypothetical protein [Chryseolinea sp.]
MKKQFTLTLFLLLFAVTVQLRAQNLISDVTGKWAITKYQSKIKTAGKSGTLEFLSDGMFRSEGIYFGVQTGLYRTDETRSIVIIEAENGITEWTASMKNDVLRLKSVKGKGPRVYLTLVRIKEEKI